MKKLISLLLILVLCLSLVLTSCNEKTPDPTPAPDPTPQEPPVDDPITGAEAVLQGFNKLIDAANAAKAPDELIPEDITAAIASPDVSGIVSQLTQLLPQNAEFTMQTPDGVKPLIGVTNGVIFVPTDEGSMYIAMAGDSIIITDKEGAKIAIFSLNDIFASDSSDSADGELIPGVDMSDIELDLDLPKLTADMLTETTDGFCQISNDYIESLIKALIDGITAAAGEQIDSETTQVIATIKSMLHDLLLNTGLKLEVRMYNDLLTGLRVAADTNNEFAALVGWENDATLKFDFSILTDTTGKKLESCALHFALEGTKLGKNTVDLDCKATYSATGDMLSGLTATLATAGDMFGENSFSLTYAAAPLKIDMQVKTAPFTASFSADAGKLTFKASITEKNVEFGWYYANFEDDEPLYCIVGDRNLSFDIELDFSNLTGKDAVIIKKFITTEEYVNTAVHDQNSNKVEVSDLPQSAKNWYDSIDFKLVTSVTSLNTAEKVIQFTISSKVDNVEQSTRIFVLDLTSSKNIPAPSAALTSRLTSVKQNITSIQSAKEAINAYVNDHIFDMETSYPFRYQVADGLILTISPYNDIALITTGTLPTTAQEDYNIVTAIAADGHIDPDHGSIAAVV